MFKQEGTSSRIFPLLPTLTMHTCLLPLPPFFIFDLALYLRESLIVSAWNLLELTRDISRAQSHFLALTLHRTESSNPRTLYSLVQAQVIPWSIMGDMYANRGNLADSSPMSPRAILDNDAQQRKREGGLGSVMILSLELPKGDNSPPIKAFKQLGGLVLPMRFFTSHLRIDVCFCF